MEARPTQAAQTSHRGEQQKEDFDPLAIETVKSNFYVDDCPKSVVLDNNAIRIARKLP